MGISYEDFDLRIVADGAGYCVLADSPKGQQRHQFVLPVEVSPDGLSPGESGETGGEIRGLRPHGRAESSPERIGALLFDSLFGGTVRQLFERCRGVLSPDRGLRIRIHFDPRDRRLRHLSSLPWELLYCTDIPRFLALDRRMPVVHSLEVPHPVQSPSVEPPLRVLIVMANPPGTPGLDLAGERRRIEEAFRSSPDVQLSFLEHADGNRLRRQVRHGKFHIVHFMGHGAFDEGEATGALILESPEGPADLLSDKTFAGLFTGIVLPVLVVLNACHTGRGAELPGRDPFAGVAAALVQEGLPAVLAMRSTIRDSAALALSEELYSRLVAGDPVEAALAEARLALSTSDPAAVDWAIPALFMRAAARTVSQDLFTAGVIERPVEPLASPAVEPQGARSEAPSFVQKIKAKRIRKQINISHADAVHLTDRGD